MSSKDPCIKSASEPLDVMFHCLEKIIILTLFSGNASGRGLVGRSSAPQSYLSLMLPPHSPPHSSLTSLTLSQEPLSSLPFPLLSLPSSLYYKTSRKTFTPLSSRNSPSTTAFISVPCSTKRALKVSDGLLISKTMARFSSSYLDLSLCLPIGEVLLLVFLL